MASECCGKGCCLWIKFLTLSSFQPYLEAECPSVKAVVEGSPKSSTHAPVACALAKLPALSNLVYVAGHFVEWPAFLLL